MIDASDKEEKTNSDLDPIEYQPHDNSDLPRVSEATYFNVYGERDEPAPIEPVRPSNLFWRRCLQLIDPSWFYNHLDRNSFKVVFRTFVQIWVTVIIAVVPRSANWIGDASYLPQIIGFILPSGDFLISINTILAVICLMYSLTGWMITVIAGAISTQIRGWPTAEEVSRALILEGTCTEANIESCLTAEIFSGRYLETRCSVIAAISLIFGVFMFGLTQQFHPMMKTPYVIGVITLVINTCYTVFFPIFEPKVIGLTVLKPMGVGLSLVVIASILIFPFTSSYKYFLGGIAVLSALEDVSKKNRTFFSSMKPSRDSFTNYRGLLSDIQLVRVKLPKLDVFLYSTGAEISYGRLSSDNAFEFSSRLKAILNVFAGYQYFYSLFQERKELITGRFETIRRHSTIGPRSASASGQNKLFAAFPSRYSEVGVYERGKSKQILEDRILSADPCEVTTLEDLDAVADAIRLHHEGYLESATVAIHAIKVWLSAANEFRAYSFLDRSAHIDEQKKSHELLLKAKLNLQEFILTHEKQGNGLSMSDLGQLHGREQTLSLISQSSVFLFLSGQIAAQLLALINFLLIIDDGRPTARFMVKLWPFGRPKRSHGIEERNTSRIRDPDALTPHTRVQVGMSKLFKAYDLLHNEFGWYWVRSALLVMVCAVPFFCRVSANYFYAHKLVWVVIMCAVSTSEYSAESVYMFISKVVFSFIGALAGMVGWYISTGSGNGNYYGYCVVTAVMYFVICYYRHFSVHLKPIPAIMIAVTPTLVLGTSWVDAKYGALDAGVGWRVFLFRFLSVLVGLCVAMLASIIPRVRSSKVAVRKAFADALEQVNVLQSRVCDFAIKRYENPGVHISSVGDELSDEIRKWLIFLAGIKAQMKSVQYEKIASGDWPTRKYERLHILITGIFQLFFLQYRVIDQVENTAEWIPHLVQRAAWNQPDFIADTVSLIYMTSEALRLKAALPELTNATMSLKHLEHLSAMWGTTKFSLNDRLYEEVAIEGDEKLKIKNLDLQKLLSHDGRLNVVSLLIMHMIYKRIDETTLVAKDLVGERYCYDQRLFEF